MSITTPKKSAPPAPRALAQRHPLQKGDAVWFGGYEGRVRAITPRQGIQVEFLADSGAHRGRLLTRLLRPDELQRCYSA